MKTAYYILLLTSLLSQVSCRKSYDEVLPSPPISEVNKNEKYSLISVSYTVIPGSVTEEITEQRPNLEYINRTSLRQIIAVDLGTIFERSTFKRNPKQDYLMNNQGQLLGVPIDIQDNQISLGQKKWMYDEEEMKLPAKLKLNDSLYVESGKKLTAKLSLIYKKIQAAYTAQLKGESSGKLITLSGVWTGVYPLRKNLTYTIQAL